MFRDGNGRLSFLAKKSLINNDFKSHEKLVIVKKSVMVYVGKTAKLSCYKKHG